MTSARIFAVALLLCVLTASGVGAATFYAYSGNTNQLYIVNTATGTATPVGNAVQSVGNNGLALDTSSCTMFVTGLNGGVGGSHFGTANTATGAITPVGSTIEAMVLGLAFDSDDGVLFGSSATVFVNVPDRLASVNRTTGALTDIGAFGGGVSIEGLAYDRSTGTLYGVGQAGASSSVTPLPQNLYTINQATGAATLVGALGVAGQTFGLEINPDTGALFATTDTSLVAINKTTGAGTVIGATGVRLHGLAALPAAPAAVSCPTGLTVGGAAQTITVTLSAPAPAGGTAITLISSAPGTAAVPSSVTVAAGQATAMFNVTPGSTAGNAQITASTCGGPASSCTFVVASAPLTVTGVTCPGGMAVAGGNGAGSVTLSGVAPSGGTVVDLLSSNTNAAAVPASVVVPAGQNTAAFTVTAGSTAGAVTITASTGSGASQTCAFTVAPAAAAAIPTLSEWALLVMIGALALAGAFLNKA